MSNNEKLKLTVREVPANKAIQDYYGHLKKADTKIKELENRPWENIPGTETLSLLKIDDKALSPASAEKIAVAVLESQKIDQKELFNSLISSLSFTQDRINEQATRVSEGKSTNPELDAQKKQFLEGEFARKESLVLKLENYNGKPTKELVEAFSKEILSQSRVRDYGDRHRSELIAKALAFKHTCEQCIRYLNVLEKEPVKQFKSRDGKMWICPAEQIRDQALLKQHQKNKAIGMER